MAKDKIFGKETVASMNEVRDTASEISSILDQFDVSQLSGGMADVAQASKDMAESLSESMQYSDENKNLAIEQSKAALLGVKYATSQNKASKVFRGIQLSMVKGGDEFTDGLKESVDVYGDIQSAAQTVVNKIDNMESGLGDLDGAFGGIGSAIGSAMTNPLGAMIGILTASSARVDAIGASFGGMGVTKFKDELLEANTAFMGMGLSGEDSLVAVKGLTSEFGVGMDEAIGMASAVGDLAKSTGMSVEESTKLTGFFQMSSGLSGEAATNLLKSADALAVANGVAPGAVLEDIANNTETFAKFGKDGGKGLMRAAIQAKKLGISLGTVANTADSLLDFQSSLNAEVEASVMLGRNVNLQKARELALTGDMEGLQEEILNVVGSEAEFNEMNVMQRKSLAQALGMEVGELQKVVMNQGKASDLQGEMAEQELPTPEEAMSSMAESMATIQMMFTQIMDEHGETFEGMFTSLAEVVPGIIEGFGNFVGFIDESIGLGNALVGVLAIMGIKSIVSAVAGIYTAFMQIPFGLGLPLAIAASAGLIATIASIGDLDSPADGKTMVSTKEGGIFELSDNDDLVAAPGASDALAAGTGGGGSSVVGMSTAKLEQKVTVVSREIMMLREEMRSYFGAGGSAVKGIGSRVSDSLMDNA